MSCVLTFRAYFLNVGNGDCTIVELPDGTIMVVDLRNARMNLRDANADFENPISYLAGIGATSVFRYVQTHPDMDHMDGLSDLSRKFVIHNFWDTKNTRKKPEEFSHGFREEDWDAYQKLRQAAKFYDRDLNFKCGQYPYDIYVLSPSGGLIRQANASDDWNLLSYVIFLEYKGFKLVLGGDASDSAWADIYDWVIHDPKAKQLLTSVTVFKTSHHGRDSSYCGAEMLELMQPQKIVISKGQVDSGQSAYGKYYSWSGGAKNMFLTSQGTVVARYHDVQKREYSIQYANNR